MPKPKKLIQPTVHSVQSLIKALDAINANARKVQEIKNSVFPIGTFAIYRVSNSKYELVKVLVNAITELDSVKISVSGYERIAKISDLKPITLEEWDSFVK